MIYGTLGEVIVTDCLKKLDPSDLTVDLLIRNINGGSNFSKKWNLRVGSWADLKIYRVPDDPLKRDNLFFFLDFQKAAMFLSNFSTNNIIYATELKVLHPTYVSVSGVLS